MGVTVVYIWCVLVGVTAKTVGMFMSVDTIHRKIVMMIVVQIVVFVRVVMHNIFVDVVVLMLFF